MTIVSICVHVIMTRLFYLKITSLIRPITSSQEEDILELELEDIEEEEELEELEEGHCHDITQDTASETKTRTSSSMASDEEEVERPKSRKQRVT